MVRRLRTDDPALLDMCNPILACLRKLKFYDIVATVRGLYTGSIEEHNKTLCPKSAEALHTELGESFVYLYNPTLSDPTRLDANDSCCHSLGTRPK